MRKHFLSILAFVLILSVCGAMAQADAHQRTTTTTTTTTTTVGPEHNIEGCIAKEQSDFFLIPQRGEPFQLQAAASQDLAGQEGHKVMLSGKWLSASAQQSANANTNANANMQSGAVAGQQQPAGTGNDLHQLSKRALVVDNIRSVADTCPVNWNPRVSRK